MEKIESFKIVKLFNKYDITIDMTQKCNIFIGPNGVGKSTALKILYHFLRKDFINIVAVPFDKIVVNYSDEDCLEMEYVDFFPDSDKLAERYRKWIISENSISVLDYELLCQCGNPKSREEMCQNFIDLLSELQMNKLYGQFVYSLYKKTNQTERISRLINKYVLYTYIEKANLIERAQYENVFKDSMVEEKMMDYRGILVDCGTSRTFFLDLVKEYSVESKPILESCYTSGNIDWIVGDSKPSFTEYRLRNESILNYRRFHASAQTINYFDICKEIYLKEVHIKKNVDNDTETSKLENEAILTINRWIYEEYFNPGVVEDINNRVQKYIMKYLELTENVLPQDVEMSDVNEEFETLRNFFEKEVIDDYNNYVKPILIRNSFFETSIVDLLEIQDPLLKKVYERNQEGQIQEKIVYASLLRDFLKEVLPIVKAESVKSEKTQKFEFLLKKYFADKYISIRPSGLRIRDSEMITESNKLFVIYDESDIDLSVISSGEKKLLILFSVAIYLEDMVIVLDEPELSLSLLWQEALLPDILEFGNMKNVIVATHSPYIAKDDSVRKYISFLPQKEK